MSGSDLLFVFFLFVAHYNHSLTLSHLMSLGLDSSAYLCCAHKQETSDNSGTTPHMDNKLLQWFWSVGGDVGC